MERESGPSPTVKFRQLRCPRCQSDGITRSHRRLWERFILPIVGAKAHRCRDCQRRFWVGAKWSRLVFASLALFFLGGVIATVAMLHKEKEEPAEPAPQPVRTHRRRPPAMPPGLPPLSQVPRPKDSTAAPPEASK